jgi:Fe-S-cluster-containing dehydrogenase component
VVSGKEGGVNKRALIVDIAKCIGCNNCVLSAKDEHIDNDLPGYAAPQPAHGHEWISLERHTRGSGSMVDVSYVPRMCNHCDDAPCIKAAGDDAIYKRDDGVVIIDPVKARGRKHLVSACPYGAISWNEEAQLPQTWFFDAHLLDRGWEKPRCVQACPTGALESVHVTDEELRALVAEQGLEGIRAELDTKPRVLYRNLERVRSCFLGGNVCRTNAEGRQENVSGAHVEVTTNGHARTAVTDHFGDFKIDGLEGGAQYSLRVRHLEFGQSERTGVLRTSENLGSISL